MSAYIVETETMQRAAICFLLGTMHWRDEAAGADAVTATGALLYEMNEAAVCERYREPRQNAPIEFVGKAMRDKRNGEHAYTHNEMVQIFKSMECLLYQCNEGEIDESDLYKRLQAAKCVVAAMIVAKLPEYESAKWA